jgi:SAM-dependent methyltransferase
MTKRARAPRKVIQGNWYDFPEYYDVSLMEDTELEADFIEAVWRKFGEGPLRRILEPGCGSGRLVRELARRGRHVVAFDDNPKALDYLRNHLEADGTTAEVFAADLAKFRIKEPVDLACCFCNTFRHLLTRDDALSHLRSVSKALRPGGVYLLGLHLMPIDVDPEDSERWTCQRDGVKVRTTLAVHKTFPRKRLERLRLAMDVDAPTERLRVESWMTLRLYNVDEIRDLLRRVGTLVLVETLDFLYDVEDPIQLDEYSSDVVFVLRRK